MPVKHAVLFKFKPMAAEAASNLHSRLLDLTAIPGVLDVSFGPTFKTERSRGYTHMLIVDLKDKTALDFYATHPQHVEAVQQNILPNIETDGILAMDIEVDRPSSL